MSFRDHAWPAAAYNSDKLNLLEQLVSPMLEHGSEYDRSVGYLESSHLAEAAKGLFNFCERGGLARFLIGNPLPKEELEAYQTARAHSEGECDKFTERLRHLLNQKLEIESSESIYLTVLQYLFATNKLQIRLVLRERGMHHPKIRIAKDRFDGVVVTVGSDNDSFNALQGNNRESGTLFCNWKYPETDYWLEHGAPVLSDFEEEWEDRNPFSITVSPSEQTRAEIAQDWEDREISPSKLAELIARLRKQSLDNRQLRPHQEQAIGAWEDAGFRGILAHCTGAGKTFTALHCAQEIIDQFQNQDESIFVVIAVPFQILAEQWVQEIEGMSFPVIRCWSENSNWQDQASQMISLGLSKALGSLHGFFVVVNDTLVTDRFQDLINQIPGDRMFFVADEVHRHGSHRFSGKIPNADYLMGLSATPWASHEIEKETILKSIYGQVIHEYGLGEALQDEVLCPYQYRIVEVHLDEDEANYYASETRQIAEILGAADGNLSASQRLELSKLYRIRSGILGTCAEKFTWLSRETRGLVTPRTLFYCSDGRATDTDKKSILRVGSLLDDNGWKVAKITAEESPKKRYKNLEFFADTSRDCLLAIRVLDEGFNLPSCERAFLLASSKNERQFIQRRGRVLRQSPETNKTHAEIVDFLVLPPSDRINDSWVPGLMESELLRSYEFARFAMNQEELLIRIESLAVNYGLDFDSIRQKVENRSYSDEVLEEDL